MRTLIHSAAAVLGHEEADCVLLDGARIAALGSGLQAESGTLMLDARGCVVWPGLVNGHHHLDQHLLRAYGPAKHVAMGGWLGATGGAFAKAWASGTYDVAAVRAACRASLAESLLSGCTTVLDHRLIHPTRDGRSVAFAEEAVGAARALHARLLLCRGSITRTAAEGGRAAAEFVQPVDEVVRHVRALAAAAHDPDPFATVQLQVGPSGIHSDGETTFRALAEVAAELGLGRHTQCNEVVDVAVADERYGRRPLDLLEAWGWLADDVSLAHMVGVTQDEIERVAAAGAAVIHCVACDLHLGWGIAPVRELLDAGVRVGLGTSGAASNDGCVPLLDARVAFLAARAGGSPPEKWLSVEDAVGLATAGGAAAVGRYTLGSLTPGAAADIVCFPVDGLDRAGGGDPHAAVLLAGLSARARHVFVAGEQVVRDGELVHADERELAADLAQTSRAMLSTQ